jgi:hypothetical protein
LYTTARRCKFEAADIFKKFGLEILSIAWFCLLNCGRAINLSRYQ